MIVNNNEIIQISSRLSISSIANKEEQIAANKENKTALMLKNGFLTSLVCSSCENGLLKSNQK